MSTEDNTLQPRRSQRQRLKFDELQQVVSNKQMKIIDIYLGGKIVVRFSI